MTKLTEHTVLARTRAQDLRSVRKLNAWGSELTDVSIVKYLPNVEVLSLSVNSISTLRDFAHCNNLQELYLRKNNILDLSEICYLKDLQNLRSLWLADNPCARVENYRAMVIWNLPQLQKLDNIPIQSDELEEANTLSLSLESTQQITPNSPEASPADTAVATTYSSDSPTAYNADHASPASKNCTPLPSPMEPFQPKLDNSSHTNSYQEETIHMHSQENERVEVSQQYYSVSTENTSRRPVQNVFELKNRSESELLPDRPDVVANERYVTSSANSFSGSSFGRTVVKSDRNSAVKMLPKGGRNRNANILSAVLCLIKELDLPSLEVVDTAVHCQMEELEAEQDSIE